MPLKPLPTHGNHLWHHTRVLIRQLKARPRKIDWILRKASETRYNLDFLEAALNEFASGGTIEQLRCERKQKSLLTQFMLTRRTNKRIKSALVQLVIKSASINFLNKVRKDHWINWFGFIRLESYCLKRKKIRLSFLKRVMASAA